MKYFEFNIDKRQAEWIFSPLRSKVDVIQLLMKTIKLILVHEHIDPSLVHGKIMLCVSKMSRLFYCSDKKCFSINFPFTVISNDHGSLVFQSKYIDDINNKVTSDLIGIIIVGNALGSNDIMEFAEPIYNISEFNEGFWSLFRELLLFDDGYIRYDFDQIREDGVIHPLHHLDVFYSSNATFKIGLRKQIEDKHLVDLLDTNSDCHYLDTV